MESEERIITRLAVPNDRNFILSTWLKGQYYGHRYFKQVPPKIYYTCYADRVLGILSDKATQVLVACSETAPEWIVGFAVFKEPDLYWIHVKEDYRGRGIATLLLQNKFITTVKALTNAGAAIAYNKSLIYNPF